MPVSWSQKKKAGGGGGTAAPEQAVVGNDPGPNDTEKAPQRRLSLIPAIEKGFHGMHRASGQSHRRKAIEGY